MNTLILSDGFKKVGLRSLVTFYGTLKFRRKYHLFTKYSNRSRSNVLIGLGFMNYFVNYLYGRLI